MVRENFAAVCSLSLHSVEPWDFHIHCFCSCRVEREPGSSSHPLRGWSLGCRSHVIVSTVPDTPLHPLKLQCRKPAWQSLAEGVAQSAAGGRGGASEGRCRAALPAGGSGALRSPASPPLERPQLRCWPEPAPRTRKHLAAGAGWLGPAGVSLGWKVSSLPSAWAVARTPRFTRPTPRWVWAGLPEVSRARHPDPVPANSLQARLGDRPS